MHSKPLFVASCLVFLASLGMSGQGAQLSDFEIIGVAQNLSLLGVSEVSTLPDSKIQQCEVRIYPRNEWEASQSKTVTSEGLDAKGFEAECKALKEKAQKKFLLSPITWNFAKLTPEPASVKDPEGNLLSDPRLLSHYPGMQQVNFTLPEKADWQVVVRSQLQNAVPSSYTVVLRDPVEPTPSRSVPGIYPPNSLLLTPVRVMTSNHYGLVTLIFREARQGKAGMDYFYHPYFLHWPECSAITVEKARDTLIQAADYAMEPDELTPGPNTMHPGYRAYMRLKTEKLSQDDIETYLDRASSAGKLYWLALLHVGHPQRYAETAAAVLKEASHNAEVLEVSGKNWQPVSFEAKLKEQIQAYQAP